MSLLEGIAKSRIAKSILDLHLEWGHKKTIMVLFILRAKQD